jgi:hypothetical protein
VVIFRHFGVGLINYVEMEKNKYIGEIIRNIPLIFINFKVIESIYKSLEGDYFISSKQIIAMIIVIIIDFLMFSKFKKIGKLITIFFFILCTLDMIRYTVQTVITESNYNINDYGFSILMQPQALKLLIIFLILNYDIFFRKNISSPN